MAQELLLETLSHHRAVDAAVEELRAAVLDGRLVPGQRLKEAAVARRLGISRTPIRQAFAVLEAEGLIEVLPHVGARVTSYGIEELEELFELRAALEALAVRRACRRIDEPTLAALHDSCDRYERLGFHDDPQLAVEENRRFHDLIAAAAGSERLRHMLRNVTAVALMYQAARWADAAYERRSVQSHRDIAAAIAERDGDRAERLVREHLLASLEVVAGHVIAPETTPTPELGAAT